jgi:hypothetical protein
MIYTVQLGPIASVNFLDATYSLIQVLIRWVNEENLLSDSLY